VSCLEWYGNNGSVEAIEAIDTAFLEAAEAQKKYVDEDHQCEILQFKTHGVIDLVLVFFSSLSCFLSVRAVLQLF
jgi:hypothetical protein